jgi:hypothetical protein
MSSSYPYLTIAKKYSLPYETVLKFLDMISDEAFTFKDYLKERVYMAQWQLQVIDEYAKRIY